MVKPVGDGVASPLTSKSVNSSATVSPRHPSLAVQIREQQFVDTLQAEAEECKTLIGQGQTKLARQRLLRDLASERSELFALPLMDLDFSEGEFMEPYKVAAALIPDGGHSWDFMLRASYAAAGVGQVFAGQRDYCLGVLLNYGRNAERTAELLSMLPKGNSAQAVAALSCLTIGEESIVTGRYVMAVPFLEAAARLDPEDPYTILLLADAYTGSAHLYSKAIGLLEKWLPRSGKGYVHDCFVADINSFRLSIQMVGDRSPVMAPPG